MANQCENNNNNTLATVVLNDDLSRSISNVAGNRQNQEMIHCQPVRSPQPPVVVQARTEFSQDIQATRENFPSAKQFNQLCAKNNFNRVLDMVKRKMFSANLSNQTFIRVLIPDTSPFPSESVRDVKVFLAAQGYSIIEIEDGAGISHGWKLSW